MNQQKINLQTNKTNKKDKIDEDQAKLDEAKKSVHIPTLFKGTTIRNYVKELNAEERYRKEQRQMAAIRIQRNYRKHLKDKRFIESRSPMRKEAVDWARNYHLELMKRKMLKEEELLTEQQK